jgi:hypothetical protein
MFGQFETDWPRLRQKLIDAGTPLVSLFVGLQWSRTSESFERREFLAKIAAYSDERPLSRETVRRYLAERHLGFPPEDGEVEGAWTLANFVLGNGTVPTRDESVRMATEFAVKELAPRIFARSWTVETCRKPVLITSDRPVMLWRPKSFRDQFEASGGTLPTKCAFR